jgi:hypothetical protein
MGQRHLGRDTPWRTRVSCLHWPPSWLPSVYRPRPSAVLVLKRTSGISTDPGAATSTGKSPAEGNLTNADRIGFGLLDCEDRQSKLRFSRHMKLTVTPVTAGECPPQFPGKNKSPTRLRPQVEQPEQQVAWSLTAAQRRIIQGAIAERAHCVSPTQLLHVNPNQVTERRRASARATLAGQREF